MYQNILKSSKKCRRSITFAWCVVCITIGNADAQRLENIEGRVVDASSRKPISFATVRISDSTAFIKNTDESGVFKIRSVKPGSYELKISKLSYKDLSIPIVIPDSAGAKQLGDILLQPAPLMLKEIKVVAQGLVSQKNDRITYNVERDPQKNVTNVLAIMSKVPYIVVDANDNIKLQDGSSYLVLFDNRPSNMITRNISEALRNMPASSIKSIEVITNPPGKYLIEGITAVINIITKKRDMTGYEGSGSLEYRTPAAGPSVGLMQTFKYKKLGINTYLGYTAYDRPNTSSLLLREDAGDIPTSVRQEGLEHTKQRSGLLNVALSYEIDSLHLLSARTGLYHQRNHIFDDLINTNVAGTEEQRYSTNNQKTSTWDGLELGVDYQIQSRQNKEDISTISYLYTHSRDGLVNDVNFTNTVNYHVNDYTQENRYRQYEHSVQVDNMKTVGKIKVNTGIKGVARIGESEFNDANLANAAQPDLPDSDHFRNNLYLLFGYNSYQLSVKSWNLNTGYRLEYAKSESFFGGQADELSLHYFNIMPDVSVRYKFNDSESLGLSFNQALQRPNISYLNPFISRLNPSLVISGNPDLEPVKTNKFNLQYSRFRKSALTASIYYSFVNNDIQQVLSNTDTIGVSKLTYANVGKKSNLGFSMSYSVGLSKTVNMNFSGNLTYLRINGMVEGKAVINKGFMTDLNAGLNYSLAKTWILDGRFSYTSPVMYLQGKTSSYPYYVFSASKTFLRNKLSASLSIVNPFKKFQDVESTYMDQHVHQTSTVQTYYRTILIRAGYRFGQLKSKIQTNRKSISNDDAISQKH